MHSLTLNEFADRVGALMPVISREFLKHQTPEFYRLKITMPQCIILEILNRAGELNMSGLARGMSVSTPAMTGIVTRLVRDGYVERVSDSDDRRVIKIKLTAKGRKTVDTLHAHRRRMIIKLFGVISQSEREEYLKILTRIRDSIKG